MAAANQMQVEDENATFFVAVHVGAGYHAPSNEKALKSAVKRACLAAGSILRKVPLSHAPFFFFLFVSFQPLFGSPESLRMIREGKIETWKNW